jgi:hypothetical protein
MQTIDRMYQTMVSELAQRSLDSTFTTEFSADGRFVPVEVKGKKFWYFDASSRGNKNRRYVGPVDDPEITGRVERFKDLKADIRTRRKLVSTLVREAYLPKPDPITGEIVQALADAGFFRLRGVLVGTVAFQTYSALLGVRLPDAAMHTGDADFAQFHSISVAVNDTLPPMLDVIRKVDETFREVPHPMDGRSTTRYVSRSGFNIEFLTPSTGSTEHDGKPTPMPALGGASAVPLRFLDFLIHEPVRAILLHKAGVPVLVPAPERYAIHKLIVASRRRVDKDGVVKARKDLRQSVILTEALTLARQHMDLAGAFSEAWNRGPSWREAIAHSLSALDAASRSLIERGLAEGLRELGDDPGEYGFAA